MDCPTEEVLIRDKLATLPGVVKLGFDLVQRSLTVNHRLPSSASIRQAPSVIGIQAARAGKMRPAQSTVLTVRQMDCPTEETLIRGKLVGVPGVVSLDFNLVQRALAVRHVAHTLSQVLAIIQSLGFDTEVHNISAVAPASTPDATPTKWWPLAISGANAVLTEVVYWLGGGNHWVVAVLALAAIPTGGLTTYKKGWIAFKSHNLNMSALISIVVTDATVIGHWPEAAMVMVLFALIEVVEARSLDRVHDVIRGSMDLAPEAAMVQHNGGSWDDVDAKTVAVGSRVQAKPGERIALDGEVLQGRSPVNQALIAGESLPVRKAEDDLVFTGTINESGSFEHRITTTANDSTLARIIHAVGAA